MHHRQLSRVIELEARYPLSTGKDGGLSQFPQLPAVDKRSPGRPAGRCGSCRRSLTSGRVSSMKNAKLTRLRPLRLVMLDEGVDGTLLCGEIPGAYRCERLLINGPFQTRADVSGSAGMAESSPVRAGSIRPHRGFSQARNIRAVFCRCVAQRYPSPPISLRGSDAAGKRIRPDS